MNILTLALTLASFAPAPAPAPAPPDLFTIQAELQGLYDEISQATLQFVSIEDADQFHSVLYTPDWVFVDTAGQRQTWAQMHEQVLHAPQVESAVQPIQKLSLVPGGAVTTVNVSTTRGIVDEEGHYGRRGATHQITETTPFRDTWVQNGDQWKLQSRTQLGPPKIHVDLPVDR
jgi:hypothetical protein